MKCKLNIKTLNEDRPTHGSKLYDWEQHKDKVYPCRFNPRNLFIQVDVKLNKKWHTFWIRYVEIYKDGQWWKKEDAERPINT